MGIAMKSTDAVLSVGSSSGAMDDTDVVSASDMNLFNAEMYSPPVKETSIADKVVDKFSSISENIGLQKSDFEKKLAKASSTADSKDILEATRAMSDYYLQAAMATKVASKASSAIDRITNLQ